MLLSSSSLAVFWVFSFFCTPNLFVVLGGHYAAASNRSVAKFFNSDATSGFWIGVIINGLPHF
jgi:hypothetical protein